MPSDQPAAAGPTSRRAACRGDPARSRRGWRRRPPWPATASPGRRPPSSSLPPRPHRREATGKLGPGRPPPSPFPPALPSPAGSRPSGRISKADPTARGKSETARRAATERRPSPGRPGRDRAKGGTGRPGWRPIRATSGTLRRRRPRWCGPGASARPCPAQPTGELPRPARRRRAPRAGRSRRSGPPIPSSALVPCPAAARRPSGTARRQCPPGSAGPRRAGSKAAATARHCPRSRCPTATCR